MALIFEWDKNKADINKQKHKITFDEATTVFSARKATKRERIEYENK